jgi:hypothetical protein
MKIRVSSGITSGHTDVPAKVAIILDSFGQPVTIAVEPEPGNIIVKRIGEKGFDEMSKQFNYKVPKVISLDK